MSPSSQTTLAEQHGCSFLAGCPDFVFGPEDFSTDEQLMVETAQQFLRKEVIPIADRIDAQEDGLMPALVRKAGALGFCGVDSPEKFGGFGLSKCLAARILENLSLNGSFSVTIGVTSGISQLGLVLFGTDEQRAKFLPSLASGTAMGAYALSEPNSGSDALSLSTRADERDGNYVLNGTKMWISNAKWAEQFLVMAKIGGTAVTAFIVERDRPGVSVSREEHKLGLKGSSTARLILEDARIPKENLLYLPGKGHHVAFNALNIGRYKLAAMSLGPAREAMYESSQYALDRKQFGQAIAEFGLVRQKFADMAAGYFAAESVLYRTGAGIDAAFARSDGSWDSNRAAAEEFAIECSAAKVLATEVEDLIIDEALQSYGGYGFTEEFPLARLYRDARVSRIYEGTNEINRVFLADRVQKRAQSGKAVLGTARDSFIAELAHEALQHEAGDQVKSGAVSDLLILTYAEQSARIRAKRRGGIAQMAYDRFCIRANVQAAYAFQTVTGKAVHLPPVGPSHVDELSDAVYTGRGPV